VKGPFNRQSVLPERIFAPHRLASLRQDDTPMTLTTGAILRRITETDLPVSAHKLATIILDGIAWKDGRNGLDHGTAAFTLAHLASRSAGRNLTNLRQMSCQPQATHHYAESLTTKLSSQDGSKSIRRPMSTTRLGLS
jgi:hypothetical protein